ncbi:MAG TPA: DUF488 domain-containing protein [Candidatus Korarchaeota archaeon]|nr:MAG: DUF488 domain-containing protein [Candidatus Korarchaeota archaeon]HDD69177.1 DUF488 domain-containing protein [Candidatus Korarchaeota archaeon]
MHLYTIGHSNRSFEEFLSILKKYGIELLIDIRSWPYSSKNPQFNLDRLKKELPAQGMAYEWLGKELGGRRSRGLGKDSPNKGWRSKGFRNYADYALGEEFRKGVSKLLKLAEGRRTAIMCAEKFYWGCHRRILADHLLVMGHKVTHIVDEKRCIEHKITPFAKIKDGIIVYPGEEKKEE